MKSAKLVILLIMTAAASLVYASVQSDSSEQPTNYFLCKNHKAVRTIRVEKDAADKQCVAFYTKAGVDREVGRAQNVSSCMKVVENIKGNLEAASWKCRELGDARITSSVDE